MSSGACGKRAHMGMNARTLGRIPGGRISAGFCTRLCNILPPKTAVLPNSLDTGKQLCLLPPHI